MTWHSSCITIKRGTTVVASTVATCSTFQKRPLMSSHKRSSTIPTQILTLGLIVSCITQFGHGRVRVVQPNSKLDDGGNSRSLPAEVTAVPGWITVADLDKFRPGRLKKDVL